ncbi:4a-hydroxytetrahydrobiopterin dehydratase [Motiliproteus sediminis]|uniref:4a-hydroxytetrahydrobiopterin dehydratase n=1 Tax=Motiliproteus sediminis TaxID=1468178 RepID=UPI001AEFE64A|nr:4a-hydroxytetrahydrobiopterin dehydratase [Motiliproteus sediminis]
MNLLQNQSCEACRADAPEVSREQAAAWMAELPEWRLVERDGVAKLIRRYRFADFVAALAFTNRVAALAEEQQHHPDILTRWGEVELSWWTHKIGGLHRNDFICAARSDALYRPE